MAQVQDVASGLLFPEGPVAMSDGSVIVTDRRGEISRVGPDGATDLVAETGGGPNGAAVGPDGKLYVCNNGKAFDYVDMGGMMLPVQPPSNFEGGRIERVDIDSGEVDVLYTECGEGRCAPPMTSSSMRTADSGSPTTACARSARTTAPACSTRSGRIGDPGGRASARRPSRPRAVAGRTRLYVAGTYTACAGGGRSPHPAWWSLHPACCPTTASCSRGCRLPVSRLAGRRW